MKKRDVNRRRTGADWRQVIVDTRNASLDRWVPIEEVRVRYANGHLTFDCTNGLYCVPENGKLPAWLMTFDRLDQ